jgi:hypothetical protein
MVSLNQSNGGIKKKLDRNYQSLNLKCANRQLIPKFDPQLLPSTCKSTKMFGLELG